MEGLNIETAPSSDAAFSGLAIVDPEFASIIPPLSPEERSGLEHAILAAGRATDALKTWNGLLLDGHNRQEICVRHGLPFDTCEVSGIDTRNDALIWIIQNQLKRKDLNKFVRCELALKLGDIWKQNAKRRAASKRGWIAEARRSFSASRRAPCFVCDKYEGICQAHHILPLDWQYERGFQTPNHEHLWLCPTHHVAAHAMLNAHHRRTRFSIAGLPHEEALSLKDVFEEFACCVVRSKKAA